VPDCHAAAAQPPRATLGGDALEVEALPADVRERVVAAVESLGAHTPAASPPYAPRADAARRRARHLG
jgi:hypothetical protein